MFYKEIVGNLNYLFNFLFNSVVKMVCSANFTFYKGLFKRVLHFRIFSINLKQLK